MHLRVEPAHFDWRWRERPALARLVWEAVARDPLARLRGIEVESIATTINFRPAAVTNRDIAALALLVASSGRSADGGRILGRNSFYNIVMLHWISMLIAGAMVALSIFFVFRPHHPGRTQPRTLEAASCVAPPETDSMPREYSCEQP